MTRTTSTTRTTRTTGPSIADLDVHDALSDATAFIDSHRLGDELITTPWRDYIVGIARACDRHGLTTLQNLEENASLVISTLTDVQNITRFLDAQGAADVHVVRNTLAAAISAAYQAHRVDPRAAVADVPALQARPGGKDRPLEDTEILLMRLWCLNQAGRRAQRDVLTAFRYAMVEAGAFPSEVARLKGENFHSTGTPQVRLGGVSGMAGQRVVTVPVWARPIVDRTVKAHIRRHGHEVNIAYARRDQARQPGRYSASASMSRILTRAYESAGVTGQIPEPLSIVRWRAAHVASTQGMDAAADLLGRDEDAAIYDFVRQPRSSGPKKTAEDRNTFGEDED